VLGLRVGSLGDIERDVDRCRALDGLPADHLGGRRSVAQPGTLSVADHSWLED